MSVPATMYPDSRIPKDGDEIPTVRQGVHREPRSEPEAPFTVAEVLALPVTVDLMTTARALGISKTVAYQLARAGQYPVPLYRVGVRYRCLRSTLLTHLGIADPTAAHEPSPLAR
jgi:hypothetical protein